MLVKSRLLVASPRVRAVTAPSSTRVSQQPLEPAQRTSAAFDTRCTEAGVRPPMESAGDACDNAMAESVFSTLEAELLSLRRFASQAEARMGCFSHIEPGGLPDIEGWYDPVRLHPSLGYRPPMTCEAAMESAVAEP